MSHRLGSGFSLSQVQWLCSLLLCSLLVLLAGCAGDRPLVERFEQEAWHAESFRLLSVTGERDGSEVVFAVRLQSDDGRRLRIDGLLLLDPQARLLSGEWREAGGPAPRSGVVSATAVDFLGGQGGQPSLGGRFWLTAAGESIYRLNLPPTTLAVTPPRP